MIRRRIGPGKRPGGFTLVELIMVLMISSLMTMLAVPLMSGQDTAAVGVATQILRSDLERAQLTAVAHPDRDIALRIDDDGGGWSLVEANAPENILQDESNGEPIALRCGQGRGQSIRDVRVESAWRGRMVIFDHLGGLMPPGPPLDIRLSSGSEAASVRISASTGWISIHP